MKTYRVKTQLHAFLTWSSEEDMWSASPSGRFTPDEGAASSY
jgi:hypothetical protein